MKYVNNNRLTHQNRLPADICAATKREPYGLSTPCRRRARCGAAGRIFATSAKPLIHW